MVSASTANACQISRSSASFLALSSAVSRARADTLGLTPLTTIRAHASMGVAPRIMGMGPVEAARKALAKAGLGTEDVDLVELNEAFAAQSVAVVRALGLDPERVNVNGGAIPLGHPIGASGTRIPTLLHEMPRRSARIGLAAMCIGGGQAIAMVVEQPNPA